MKLEYLMNIKYKHIAITILSLISIIHRSKFFVKFSNIDSRNKTCLIFGNGPSLTNDICSNIDHIKHMDTFCVGRFAETELYQLIKPRYYVFADPTFWQTKDPGMLKIRARLFNEIVKKTTWDLIICAPFEARFFFEKVFTSNRNIKLSFYNNVPMYGIKFFVHLMYDLNLAMPEAQNVLIPSIFLALKTGYKNIILLGADHSWHETLTLDESNRPCLRDSHFYDKNVELRPFSMDGSNENIFTMASLFLAFSKMFDGYLRIQEYAISINSRIFNSSSTTYIDAFTRKNFNDAISSTQDAN